MKLSMLGKSKKQGSGAFEDPPLVSPKEGKDEKAAKPGLISKITSRASLKTKKTAKAPGAVENGGAAPALHVSKSEKELKAAFRVYDVDSDGRISTAELSKVLTSLGGEISDGEVQELMKQIDKDHDGFISVEEFVEFHQSVGGGEVSPVHADPMRDAFKTFDKDGDSRISASELQAVLVSLGDRGHSLDECKNMISSVDKDGDGYVDFAEFQELMGAQ